MGRLTLLFILALAVSGCASTGKKHVEFRDKPIPVYIVPAPPTVQRPALETERLTAEDRKNDGKVAQAYTTALKQALIYSGILESIVNKYKELAEKSEQKLRALQGRSTGTDPGPLGSSGDPVMDALMSGSSEDVTRNLPQILLHQSATEEFNRIQQEADRKAEKDFKE